jgi:hypothetical protein
MTSFSPPGSLLPAVRVKPVSEGGNQDEIMAIGHSIISKTFLPEVAQDPNDRFTVCDCPGFLDNRGVIINVANACNIRMCLVQASAVKIVILLNFHSLKADRGRSFTDLVEMLNNLFDKQLESFGDSILLGINQVPPELSLDKLKDWFTNDKDPIKIKLSEHMFIFDPLQEEGENENASNRDDILDEIDCLVPIENGREVFKTVITSKDMQELLKISEEIKSKIKTALEEGRLEDASTFLADLERVRVIDNVALDRILGQSFMHVQAHFTRLTSEFDRSCFMEEFDKAEEFLRQLKTGGSFFGEELDNLIETNRREVMLKQCVSRADDRLARDNEAQEQLRQHKDQVEELLRLLEEEKKRTNEMFQVQESENLSLRLKVEQEIETTKEAYARMTEAIRLEMEEQVALQAQEMFDAHKSKEEVDRATQKLEAQYDRRFQAAELEKQELIHHHELEKTKREEELRKVKAEADEKIKQIEEQQVACCIHYPSLPPLNMYKHTNSYLCVSSLNFTQLPSILL